MSLKALRTPWKIDDNFRVFDFVDDDYGHFWLGVVSSVMFLIVSICSKDIAAVFVGFYKDYGHGAGVLD